MPLSLNPVPIVVTLLLAGIVVVKSGVLDDINEAINAVACPLQHTSKYDKCSSVVNPFYRMQSNLLEDSRKERCCSLLALRDCTKVVSYIMCGSERNTAELAMDTIKTLNVECIGVNNIADCLHPLALILILLVFLCIIVGIFRCLISCLCGTRR